MFVSPQPLGVIIIIRSYTTHLSFSSYGDRSECTAHSFLLDLVFLFPSGHSFGISAQSVFPNGRLPMTTFLPSALALSQRGQLSQRGMLHPPIDHKHCSTASSLQLSYPLTGATHTLCEFCFALFIRNFFFPTGDDSGVYCIRGLRT